MKRLFLAAVALLCCTCLSSCSSYNNMVSMDENINRAWANVETQYQRRADLIPNLVSTVKGYATHEQQTLTEVVEARATAMGTSVNINGATAAQIAEYQQAQSAVSSALSRLIAISENYPELKANQGFIELQAQLEGTENRISVARSEFNNATAAYNAAIRRFPANLIASMFDFESKAYFEAEATAATAPKVEF